ncbi:hypothetical protein BGAL_0679g00060 [Botrytis galanthina]|uniref:Rhodopsin domain-containing protein n=1 Tax=Botrytis galanthina TaxID=278940 RepID=A0A4S8QMI2_9HELO|nr:hypothetical protein BGAL_0679g00060 [Botrytis galanthina]
MTDIVIFLIPVPVVWKLNVPLRVKVELAVEFFIGGLGMVVCAVAENDGNSGEQIGSYDFGKDCYEDGTGALGLSELGRSVGVQAREREREREKEILKWKEWNR